jgi:hypothetical protein
MDLNLDGFAFDASCFRSVDLPYTEPLIEPNSHHQPSNSHYIQRPMKLRHQSTNKTPSMAHVSSATCHDANAIESDAGDEDIGDVSRKRIRLEALVPSTLEF